MIAVKRLVTCLGCWVPVDEHGKVYRTLPPYLDSLHPSQCQSPARFRQTAGHPGELSMVQSVRWKSSLDV